MDRADGAGSAEERTLIILKPEVLEWGIKDKVLAHFPPEQFRPEVMKQCAGSKLKFQEHYKEVIERVGAEVGAQIVDRMTRGDCCFIIYRGNGVVARARELIGATDPAVAAAGTVRALYGKSVQYNVIHASDSAAAAEREIQIWFPELSPPENVPILTAEQYFSGC